MSFLLVGLLVENSVSLSAGRWVGCWVAWTVDSRVLFSEHYLVGRLAGRLGKIEDTRRGLR